MKRSIPCSLERFGSLETVSACFPNLIFNSHPTNCFIIMTIRGFQATNPPFVGPPEYSLHVGAALISRLPLSPSSRHTTAQWTADVPPNRFQPPNPPPHSPTARLPFSTGTNKCGTCFRSLFQRYTHSQTPSSDATNTQIPLTDTHTRTIGSELHTCQKTISASIA
jgi:hypothetical protein